MTLSSSSYQYYTTFLILVAFFISSCDSDEDKFSESISVETPMSLIGSWRSGCVSLSDFSSTREVLDISDGFLTSTIRSYLDEVCFSEKLDRKQTLKYSLEISPSQFLTELYNYRLTLLGAAIGELSLDIDESIFSKQISGQILIDGGLLFVTDDPLQSLEEDSITYLKI